MGDCIVLSAEPKGTGYDVGLFFLIHVLYENINKLELFSHSFLIRSTSMCEISSQLLQALTSVYEKKLPEVDGSCLFSVLIEMFQLCLSSCVYSFSQLSLSAFCAFVFLVFSSWFGSLTPL